MKRKIAIILSLLLLLIGLIPNFSEVKVSAKENSAKETKKLTDEEINRKLDELFEKKKTDVLMKEIDIYSKNRTSRVARVQVSFNKKGELFCTNLDNGKGYYCVPSKSYVGYGYANSLGAVGCLQGLFILLGAQIDLDGIFGPQTNDAIWTFQRKNPTELIADGIAGPKTFNWAIFLVFSEDGWA